ncbi:hypothetical protein IF2G_08259 [Cordyceps javanica]|nr:hypothetical protein IF2G_08259 [Cordyceps javanica]
MRLRICIHWIVSAISLLGYVEADEATHSREKMTLYVIYDSLCDVYGADAQKMIYAQNPKHPWLRRRNMGTGVDKRFQYPEFMARADGSNMLPAEINWNIRSPLDVGIDDAIDDLAKNQIGGGTMKVGEVSPDLEGWKPPTNDPLKKDFTELFERALEKWRQLSTDPHYNTLLGKNRKAVTTLLISQIFHSRREETMNWVAKDLQKKYPNVVAPETPSSVPGRDPYKKINIEASLAAYTDANGRFTGAFGKDFSDRAAFISFVDENGKPPVGAVGDDVPSTSSGQHWRILQTWKKAYGFNLMSPATAKSHPTATL